MRVIPGSVTYEKRYANWLTWMLVIFTAGIAAFAWPLILFGHGSVTIPRNMIQGVDVRRGVGLAKLVITSTTETVEFTTDLTTAEQARNILLSAM